MTRLSKSKSVGDASAQRLNIKIPSSAYNLLVVHALMTRRTPGEVVASLIEGGCKDFHIRRNPAVKATANVSASGVGDVELVESIAA
jgi:hypothetical protein